MIEKFCYEKVIDLVMEMLRDNINIYYNNKPDRFLQIREYCKNNEDTTNLEVDQYQLGCFTQEVLFELLTCEYLYDFRALE